MTSLPGPVTARPRDRLRQALAEAQARLAAAGVPSPAADARALAAHVLGVPPTRLALLDGLGAAEPMFAALVERRAAREPLQHLTGRVAFRYLELVVGPGVFVPRPETESLVGWAVAALTGGPSRATHAGAAPPQAAPAAPAPVCVDLCAGSGAVGLSLAREVPGAVVHLVERDPRAHAWAARNVRHQAAAGGPPVRLHLADALDPGAAGPLAGQVDLVVANPPYLPAGELDRLPPEVGHDPRAALDGGPDGLALLPGLLEAAATLLRPGGLFAVEHGEWHGPQVRRLLCAPAWSGGVTHRDLTGRERFTTSVRASGPRTGGAG